MELSERFPEKVPDDVPGPMIPIYHNVRKAAQTFANVVDTSVPKGVETAAALDVIQEVFDEVVDHLKNWKG